MAYPLLLASSSRSVKSSRCNLHLLSLRPNVSFESSFPTTKVAVPRFTKQLEKKMKSSILFMILCTHRFPDMTGILRTVFGKTNCWLSNNISSHFSIFVASLSQSLTTCEIKLKELRYNCILIFYYLIDYFKSSLTGFILFVLFFKPTEDSTQQEGQSRYTLHWQ